MKQNSTLLLLACIFALTVIMIGAYTRLTNAGLGCPDWPGCYGNMLVADNVVEGTKAWTEMIHRYFAGTLGILIAALTVMSIVNKRMHPVRGLLILTTGLVVFQAALGMWTVTWKLHPTVVMGHLLGGMLIFTLLSLAYLIVRDGERVASANRIHRNGLMHGALRLGVLLVFMQIALGGWTSSNYAALACTDFPTCRGMWWPVLHLKEAFQLAHPIGANYEGGIFTFDIRATIQFIHRVGALIVLVVWTILAGMCLRVPSLRALASTVLGLLALQIGLGISNIVFSLPLAVAVLHNGVAALLLVATVTLCYRYGHPREHAC